jgi:hypothetical protein
MDWATSKLAKMPSASRKVRRFDYADADPGTQEVIGLSSENWTWGVGHFGS